MNTQEITNRVYDTLMDNGHISPAHITIDLNEVTGQEVDAAKHLIAFEYEGQRVTLHVTSKPLQATKELNKHLYSEFATEWRKTHSISAPPSFTSWKSNYKNK